MHHPSDASFVYSPSPNSVTASALALGLRGESLAAGERVGVEVRLLAEGHDAVALARALVVAKNRTSVFATSSNTMGTLGRKLGSLTWWQCGRPSGCAAPESQLKLWTDPTHWRCSQSPTYLSQIARSFLFQRKRTCRSWFSAMSWRTAWVTLVSTIFFSFVFFFSSLFSLPPKSTQG